MDTFTNVSRPDDASRSGSHAPRTTFLVVTGLAFAAILSLASFMSIVAAVPVMIAWAAVALGYFLWRHYQSRHGDELHPRATGAATLVGGDAHRAVGEDARSRDFSRDRSTARTVTVDRPVMRLSQP